MIEVNLRNMKWHEVIVWIFYKSCQKFFSNKDILGDSIFVEYSKFKKNSSLDGTVSKNLNMFSSKGISSDKQRKKTGPYYFIKNADGLWGLTDDGKELGKILEKKLNGDK